MGPMLMTGLACFGTAVAIGLLTTSTSRPTGPTAGPSASRGLAIILIAIAMGSAVLGVVVGLLAIETGDVTDPASGLLAVGPAIAGAIVGIGMIVPNARDSDPEVLVIGVLFILGLASLGAVVALLANVIPGEGATPPSDWPLVILGVASGASAIGIGATGRPTLRAMKGADESTSKAISARQISRGLPFQAVSVGASVIAILLIVLD